jgi:hypothetical protein
VGISAGNIIGITICTVPVIVIRDTPDMDIDGVVKRKELDIKDVMQQQVLAKGIAQRAFELESSSGIVRIVRKTDSELPGFLRDEK